METGKWIGDEDTVDDDFDASTLAVADLRGQLQAIPAGVRRDPRILGGTP
jgi:hypothetical protein